MTDVNGRVYTEAEIEAKFGDAYNQAKDEDDSKYDTPFRKSHECCDMCVSACVCWLILYEYSPCHLS
jgi:hypothetical protein